MESENSDIVEEKCVEENNPKVEEQTSTNDQSEVNTNNNTDSQENQLPELVDIADDGSANSDNSKNESVSPNSGTRIYNFGPSKKKVHKREQPPWLVGIRSKKKKSANSDVKKDVAADASNDVTTDDVSVDSENTSDASPLTSTPHPRNRRRRIYNDDDDDVDDDPATRKEKQKKRAIEYKLSKLKTSFNEPEFVSGKRQKKTPQRFELPIHVPKRRDFTVDSEHQGNGQHLCDIRLINQEILTAPINTLRLLHRIMYYRLFGKGSLPEKALMKNVLRFNGFPFEASDPQFVTRKELLHMLTTDNLKQISQCLCLNKGDHEVMVNRIANFLLKPSAKSVEAFIQEKFMATAKQQQQQKPSSFPRPTENLFPEDDDPSLFPMFNLPLTKVDLSAPWKKPVFFVEGDGVKLKYIRAVIANIEAASDAFVELLHRLLYLNVDEKSNMRRNILEFSGLNCELGTPNHVYRVRILSVLPMEQLKLICRVLCLPTWHKPRAFLTESIMDFLSNPRISAMKKRVPPVFSEEISFSFDSAKTNKVQLPELKTDEMEEIEIVPDIHMPDDNVSHMGTDYHVENEYLGVKLKNFSNIHYQVISTQTSNLSDLHMILYLTAAQCQSVRKNILEFSGFAFDENSTEYLCRRTLMETYNPKELKRVATVLCVSQYICDDSKKSLIDAILKFLVKPSALLNSSTIMPTISQSPLIKSTPVVKKVATSTSERPGKPIIIKPEITITKTKTSCQSKDTSVRAIIEAIAESETKMEIEKVKACLSNSSIEITPVPAPSAVKEVSRRKLARPSKIIQEPESILPDKPKRKRISTEIIHTNVEKKPFTNVKKVSTVASRIQYFGSDDEDDQPLSKMIGHPNDDHLKALVLKVIKDSKLENITMKHVIKKVFEAYPNYDLNYRKEFIKSNVRLILSQMDEQNCSVSTTVINI